MNNYINTGLTNLSCLIESSKVFTQNKAIFFSKEFEKSSSLLKTKISSFVETFNEKINEGFQLINKKNDFNFKAWNTPQVRTAAKLTLALAGLGVFYYAGQNLYPMLNVGSENPVEFDRHDEFPAKKNIMNLTSSIGKISDDKCYYVFEKIEKQPNITLLRINNFKSSNKDHYNIAANIPFVLTAAVIIYLAKLLYSISGSVSEEPANDYSLNNENSYKSKETPIYKRSTFNEQTPFVYANYEVGEQKIGEPKIEKCIAMIKSYSKSNEVKFTQVCVREIAKIKIYINNVDADENNLVLKFLKQIALDKSKNMIVFDDSKTKIILNVLFDNGANFWQCNLRNETAIDIIEKNHPEFLNDESLASIFIPPTMSEDQQKNVSIFINVIYSYKDGEKDKIRLAFYNNFDLIKNIFNHVNEQGNNLVVQVLIKVDTDYSENTKCFLRLLYNEGADFKRKNKSNQNAMDIINEKCPSFLENLVSNPFSGKETSTNNSKTFLLLENS